jgi:hypothetical protein
MKRYVISFAILGAAAFASVATLRCGTLFPPGKPTSGTRVLTPGPDCPSIEEQMAAEKAKFPLPPIDLSCKVDDDCTIGAPHTPRGSGDVMSESSAEARDAASQDLIADATEQQLEAKYQEETCDAVPTTGAQIVPLTYRAFCESGQCKAVEVPGIVQGSCDDLSSELAALREALPPAEFASDADVLEIEKLQESTPCTSTATQTGTDKP